MCGKTMFKKAGKGFNKPFCANPECPNFLPEDKRGYRRRKTDDAAASAEGGAPAAEEKACGAARDEKKSAAKKDHGCQEAGCCQEDYSGQEACRGQEDDHKKDYDQESGRINGKRNCDRRGPGRVRMCLAAGPTGHSRGAAGDEAGEEDPRPCDRLFCGAVLLQFPAGCGAGERRGPAERGAAAAGQSDPPLRGRHGGARRRCAGGGPRGFCPHGHRVRAGPSQYHHGPRRGDRYTGGECGHRQRPADL